MASTVDTDHLDPRVAATRARVLDAVGTLLEREGVTGVTHSAVARAALVSGVSRARSLSLRPLR